MRNTRLSRKRASLQSNALWAFLNSSFGLWFLSAIFISGVGSAYTYWHDRAEDEAAARLRVQKLDAEIGYRFQRIFTIFRDHEYHKRRIEVYRAMRDEQWLSSAVSRVEQVLTGMPIRDQFAAPGLREEIDRAEALAMESIRFADVPPHVLVNAAPGPYFPALYPEYRYHNLSALVASLHDEVPQSEQEDLTRVLIHLTPFPPVLSDIDAAKHLSWFVIHKRWQKGIFRRCPEESDFLCLGPPIALPEQSLPKIRGPNFKGHRPHYLAEMLETTMMVKDRKW